MICVKEASKQRTLGECMGLRAWIGIFVNVTEVVHTYYGICICKKG